MHESKAGYLMRRMVIRTRRRLIEQSAEALNGERQEKSDYWGSYVRRGGDCNRSATIYLLRALCAVYL